MIGIYWGRFNPPHAGHINIIKKILRELDSLIIVIGSSQIRNTKRNPFSGNERKAMMLSYLKEERLDLRKITVLTLSDKETFAKSVDSLFKKCKFDIIYTDKRTIINQIKKRAKVKIITRTGQISSTKIRQAIAKDKKWEHLTGKSVSKLINSFNGQKRIKKAQFS